MRRVLMVAAFVLAVFPPQGFAARPALKTPDLNLTVTQAPAPALRGQSVEISVAVAPPEGITLNRYPGITLKIEKSPGVQLTSDEAFVGERKPIEDPKDFPFKTIDPLKLSGKVTASGGGRKTLEGTLTFFYCVKASGYCAPAKTPVKIPVQIQ